MRIWDLDPEGSWTCRGNEWQAHKGPVKCVDWAHPEFGQLIATAGSGEFRVAGVRPSVSRRHQKDLSHKISHTLALLV